MSARQVTRGVQPSTRRAFAVVQIRAEVSPEIVKNCSPSRCSRAASRARARSLPAIAWIGVPSAACRGHGLGRRQHPGRPRVVRGGVRQAQDVHRHPPPVDRGRRTACSPIRLVRPYTSVASGGTDSSSVRSSQVAVDRHAADVHRVRHARVVGGRQGQVYGFHVHVERVRRRPPGCADRGGPSRSARPRPSPRRRRAGAAGSVALASTCPAAGVGRWGAGRACGSRGAPAAAVTPDQRHIRTRPPSTPACPRSSHRNRDRGCVTVPRNARHDDR